MRDEQTFDVHPTKQPNAILSLIFFKNDGYNLTLLNQIKCIKKDGQSNRHYLLFDIRNVFQSNL